MNTQPSFSLSDFEQLISQVKNEILTSHQIECRKLGSSIEMLTNKIEIFENSLSDLQVMVKEHEEKIASLKSTVENLQANLAVEITEEMEQRSLRATNLIISGISELNSGSVDDRKEHDENEIKAVINEMEIQQSPNYFQITRIGRPRQDRPRLIKLVCPDIHTKRLILRNGKSLRSSTRFRNIFVNEDRTPMQQEQFRVLRAELQRRRETGEDVVIFRQKVMKRSDIENFRPRF